MQINCADADQVTRITGGRRMPETTPASWSSWPRRMMSPAISIGCSVPKVFQGSSRGQAGAARLPTPAASQLPPDTSRTDGHVLTPIHPPDLWWHCSRRTRLPSIPGLGRDGSTGVSVPRRRAGTLGVHGAYACAVPLRRFWRARSRKARRYRSAILALRAGRQSARSRSKQRPWHGATGSGR